MQFKHVAITRHVELYMREILARSSIELGRIFAGTRIYVCLNAVYENSVTAFWSGLSYSLPTLVLQLPLRGYTATVRRRMQREVGAPRRSGKCISSTFPPGCNPGELRDPNEHSRVRTNGVLRSISDFSTGCSSGL